MSDLKNPQHFVAVFRQHIENTLGPTIQAALTGQHRAETAMLQQWRGHRMAGVSWPASSHSVSVLGDRFHFNMPASLADDEACAHIEAALDAAEEVTGLSFDGRRIRGGSNYVVDGKLQPTPVPSHGFEP
jgi:hypothetical protein